MVFVSALEGHGRLDVMRQVVDTYEKWCLRLPTSRLNRWLHKVCHVLLSISEKVAINCAIKFGENNLHSYKFGI